ncbi:MAG: FAD:protein FMN transferase [Verrucomicrobiota bacterium]|jgi:thiamine biosynthesis lipoprotein|nr:FAD:protein FMN transferase [Verrucomicrobiota bacterium]MDD8046083.1 FAD:protein FMN transferase [Verrucomicrobiota bacterium]MDI9385831.1 FAD:protein FMN transferase [Verrucomicrobiota bacterium]
MKRRGLCIVPILALVVFARAQDPTNPAPKRFRFQHHQMGTTFTLLLYAQDETQAVNASAQAFARLDQLNAILSDYDSKSELNLLSYSAGQDQPVPVSPTLWNVLQPSLELSRQSKGAFDPTVGPVVTLWRLARSSGMMPTPEAIAAAQKGIGYDKIVLDSSARTALLTTPNMKLDLGGIAKGYAGDEVLRILGKLGVCSALVNAGGDITVSAAPPDRDGWRIGIGALEAATAPPAYYVVLEHAAVATSGDAWQYFELDGQRFSHLVDPKTGVGLTDHSSVTVIVWDQDGRNGLLADGLASAISVMGPEAGIAFADQRNKTATFIVRRPQDQTETYHSRSFLELKPLSREQVEALQRTP